MKKISRKKTRAQSLVEYGLILALVSVVAIAVLGIMGTKIKDTVGNINERLEEASNTSSQNSGT